LSTDEPNTIDSIIESGFIEDAEKRDLEHERMLGATALLAQRKGRDDLAAEILLINKLRIEWNNDDWNDREAFAVIEVETENVNRFTDQLLTDLLSMLKIVDQEENRDLTQIILSEKVPPVPVNWRDVVKQGITDPKVSNQGRTVRHNVKRYEEDGLQFSNALEVRFYQLLKLAQENLPPAETFSIFPMPGQRVVGRNFEPDFVIVYEGKAAIIELDGGNHSRRVAADQSRDRLMKNAGFKLIERLAVEEVQSTDEVKEFIGNVLKRLSKS
jgi:very-short-patch-repair endonuclease